MLGLNLKRLIEAEVKNGVKKEKADDLAVFKLTELLKNKKIEPEQISLKEMAVVFCGEDWYHNLNPNSSQRFTETSYGAVNSTAFSNITGQLIYSKIHEGYKDPVFIGNQLVTTMKTKLETEKVPGHQSISADAMEVKESMPYPSVGFGESFQQLPSTKKYGLQIGLTKESIFFDRTGMLLNSAKNIGYRLAIRKEKEILDTVIGAQNNYNYRDTNYNTFSTTKVGSVGWINDFSGNALNDWHNIDISLQNFSNINDPDSGDPILIMPDTILVSTAKYMSANRIISATEIRNTVGETETISENPLKNKGMKVLTSQLLLSRIRDASTSGNRTVVETNLNKSKEFWWIGSPKKAFLYLENWPLTLTKSPKNSEAEFNQDIVQRWRASERGVCAVFDPRYWQRNKLN